MKFKKLLPFTLAASALVTTGCLESMDQPTIVEETGNRIVGGIEATPGEFPFMVSLQSRSGSHFCGASVIDKRWVLTAAHCVEGSSASRLQVAIGVHNLNSSAGTQVIPVTKVVSHESYNSNSLTNDIAILELSEDVDPKFTPIEIAATTDYTTGTNTTVIGWGALREGGSSPSRLQKVDVPVVSLASCRTSYGSGSIYNYNVCAGLNQGGKDSCQGDSGGPLFIKQSGVFKQVGVVSWGSGCARPDKPGVYTGSAHFVDWISDNMTGTTPVPDPIALEDGVPETGIAAATGKSIEFYIDAPEGAGSLAIEISGGSGDADLYTKFAAKPTDSSYDCRPYESGNSELCSYSTTSKGRYYVNLKAYSGFSGVKLLATFNPDGGTGPAPGDSGKVEAISVDRNQWMHQEINLSSSLSKLTVKITGGTGDADLYVRKGTKPSTTDFDCRPYKNGNSETCTFTNPSAGTWYLSVRGYSKASGVTLEWLGE